MLVVGCTDEQYDGSVVAITSAAGYLLAGYELEATLGRLDEQRAKGSFEGRELGHKEASVEGAIDGFKELTLWCPLG